MASLYEELEPEHMLQDNASRGVTRWQKNAKADKVAHVLTM